MLRAVKEHVDFITIQWKDKLLTNYIKFHLLKQNEQRFIIFECLAGNLIVQKKGTHCWYKL